MATTSAFINDEFDALVDEAKQTVDPAKQGELFQQAEDILLNKDTVAVPINWYRGDYVYNDDIARLPADQLRSDRCGSRWHSRSDDRCSIVLRRSGAAGAPRSYSR